MKKWFILCWFLSLPAFAVGSKLDLQRQLEAFLAGATMNDAEQHDVFWADELVYTSSAGTRFGKQALMDNVNKTGLIKPEEIEMVYSAKDVNIRLFGDMALLDFTLVGTNSDNTENAQHYLNSGVFVWRDNRWQVVNWHATLKGPAASQ